MGDKKSKAFYHRISIICIAVILSITSLTVLINNPNTAHATTLPAYRYTKSFDTTDGNAWGESLATDNLGNIYITGYFNGTVHFGGSDTLAVGIYSATFITKFNVDGTYGWTKSFNGNAWGSSIATDNLGNIYITGYFNGTVDFGGTDNFTASEGSDAFITKFNVDGTYGWTKDFIGANSTSYSYGYGIATDNLGNIYVSGDYSGTVDFGDSDTLTTAGDDGYVTKYNADGSYDWTKDFGVTSNSNDYFYGDDIAIDNSGNIYVTGSFGGTVTFGGLDTLTTSAESNGMFLTSYQVSESSVEPIITTTPTPYSTIKSPDTGYGAYQDNPIANLMYFVSSALVLGFLAVLARRLKGLSK